MKTRLKILIAVCIVFQLFSCKKVTEKFFSGVDVNLPAVQITLPPVIAVSPDEFSLGSFTQQINLDSSIKANTAGLFGINAVSSIKVKQVKIDISNADQLNNLSNFQSGRMTLQSNTNNIPAELFSVTFPDTYASTITVIPQNAPELLFYFKGTTVTYNLFGKMRRITNRPLDITLTMILRVS